MSSSSSSSSSATASLSPLLPILNAFNHRHHNQHRLAHWWPVFRIFRRTIRALIDDLAPSSLPLRPRREASSPPPRAVWLSKHFIPRAYVAFTQLAADNQHAPLGLLLLAILSRTHAVLSQLLNNHNHSTPPISSSNRSNDASQDKGVAIARQEQPQPPTERLQTQITTAKHPSDERQTNKLDQEAIKPSKTKSKEASSKDKKKKKKGKDELSSLFGSLG